MPSYFFHIIFDLDRLALSSDRLIWHRSSDKKFRYSSTVSTKSNDLEDLHVPHFKEKSEDIPHDWRYDKISVKDVEMQPTLSEEEAGNKAVTPSEATGHIANGLNAGPGPLATKGRYEPLDPQHEELGWGVVRLYRDSEETTGLYDEPEQRKSPRNGRYGSRRSQDVEAPFKDEDCTTLCILAVPSYLTPSDFLGFVGEKTRDEVSHFRMIRTERGNRYMVLMKFRSGNKAREWRRAWNGKPFDGMEVCRWSDPRVQQLIWILSSLRTVMSCLSNPSSFEPMTFQDKNRLSRT